VRRITVDEVKAAYEKTGLKPTRGEYIYGRFCACAMGALAVANGVPCDYDAARSWAFSQYGADYCNAFANGFDSKSPWGCDEVHEAGQADGELVAAAIFGEVSP
jgi:hypothetical protein